MTWFHGRPIVVPFDYSAACVRAVRFAERFAEGKSKVHVVHVLIDWYPTDPAVVLANYDEAEFKSKAYATINDKLREAGIDLSRLDIQVGIGDPGSWVADLAEKIDAGLIIVPSHGRRGFQRVLLGSVAERVVRLAKCHVLVLKSDLADLVE